ncbi:MAG: hypothetical protein PHV48_01315 [Candidatus Omnitrophica bacterium]|nr:hypothetical protein [Candidatus Omnitrophota bacterium]
MRKIFQFPGERFSLWWFSLIAEKSPSKTDAYEKLVSVLVGSKSVQDRYSCRESLLRCGPLAFLMGLCAFFRFLFRVCLVKVFLREFKKRVTSLKHKSTVVVSYFPFFDKIKAEAGIFEDRYISAYHRLLAQMRPDSYAHVCIQVNINETGLRRSLSQLKRFSGPEPLFFLEEFFKISHLWKILFYYLYFSAVSAVNGSRIKKLFLYSYEGRHFDVWKIFKGDFHNSFSGPVLMLSLWYIFLFRAMTDNVKQGTRVITTAEMYNWEKALYLNAKRKDLITIAYQHTHVPELLLNYFHDPQEIGGDDFLRHCPLPDYIATVGRLTADLFQKYGWPEDRIFIWGAQRFEQIRALRNISHVTKERYFVCAFSLIPSEAAHLLRLFAQAFPEYPGYRIMLKSHPVLDCAAIARSLHIDLDERTFEYTDRPLEELTGKSQGMIVTESSSCFYSLASGRPVIVPVFEGKLDLNPLSYVTDIPTYVYDAKGLRDLCDSITNGRTAEIIPEKFNAVLDQYLYFPSDNTEYVEKIERLN